MNRYVETAWSFEGRDVVLGGSVDGDEIRTFTAETDDGAPVRVPDALMPAALQKLVDVARSQVTS